MWRESAMFACCPGGKSTIITFVVVKFNFKLLLFPFSAFCASLDSLKKMGGQRGNVEVKCVFLLVWISLKVKWLTSTVYWFFPLQRKVFNSELSHGHMYLKIKYLLPITSCNGSGADWRQERLDKHAQSKSASMCFPRSCTFSGHTMCPHGRLRIKPSRTAEEACKLRNIHPQSAGCCLSIWARFDSFSTQERQSIYFLKAGVSFLFPNQQFY